MRVELAGDTEAAVQPMNTHFHLLQIKIEATRVIVFSVENDRPVAKEIKIGKLSGNSVRF